MADILDPSTPTGGSPSGQMDDELRALKRFLRDVYGVPVAPNQLLTPAMSIDVNGVVTFTSPPKGMRGMPGVYGFTAANNVATPTTKLDMAASLVVAKDPNTHVVAAAAPATLTVDTALAGPAVLGRDQAAVFSNNTWIHFYYIYNPTTATLSAICSNSSSAPTLPSGFTQFAYAVSVLKDGTGILRNVIVRGSWVWLINPVTALSGGVSTSDAAISLSLIIPPNAYNFQLACLLIINTPVTSGGDIIFLSLVAGNDFAGLSRVSASAGFGGSSTEKILLPNISQQFLYRIQRISTGGTFSADFAVLGYSVGNGDS